MTKKQAINAMIDNSITAVIVYGQYDLAGREFCKIIGFHSKEAANDWMDYLQSGIGQEDFSWPEYLTPEEAIRRRKCIGWDISTNIEDNWERIPVGLEGMIIR